MVWWTISTWPTVSRGLNRTVPGGNHQGISGRYGELTGMIGESGVADATELFAYVRPAQNLDTGTNPGVACPASVAPVPWCPARIFTNCWRTRISWTARWRHCLSLVLVVAKVWGAFGAVALLFWVYKIVTAIF